MLLVLFHEIGAPKINLFRCFLLSRLGLRELVGTGCFGRSAELNVQRFGFLVKPGVDFLGFKLLVKIKLDSVRSGLAQTFDVLRLFHAPTRLTQSELTSVLINVLFLRRCRLGDITRSMCNVSLSRYYNVGGIYLVGQATLGPFSVGELHEYFGSAPVPCEAAWPNAYVLCEQLGRV